MPKHKDKRQASYFGNYTTFSGLDVICDEKSSERLGWIGRQGTINKGPEES